MSHRRTPLLERLLPVSGGAAVMLVLFGYGLINSFSMSYMGNTSERVAQFIISGFLGHIALFMGKILLAYLAIGAALGIGAWAVYRAADELFDLDWSALQRFVANAAAGVLVVHLFLFRDIIAYPQVYINNFHAKNALNRFVFDALTEHLSPALFSVVIYFSIALAVAAGGFLLYRFDPRIARWGGALSGAAVIITLLAVNLDLSRPGDARRPNMLILLTDALRADRLSALGYARPTTPHLDLLVKDGAAFENAFIEAPRTFPSMVSYLTGQYASTHGIRHMFPAARDLKKDFVALPRILRESGYRTAVVADYAGDVFSRIDLGFEAVDTPFFNFNAVIEQAVLDNHVFLLPFLTGRAGLFLFPVLRDSATFCPPRLVGGRVIEQIRKSHDRPFFITAFFSATHFPYAPPHPYYAMFRAKGYRGPYRYLKQRELSLDGAARAEISAADIAQVRALYDAGVRAFDDAAGDILRYLSRKGALDDTIVVVLSDHGENLYEHEFGMGHGEHFRGYHTIRVPLVMRHPRLVPRGARVRDLAHQVDLAPTLLALAGLPAPDSMEGASLVPALRGGRLARRYAYGETGIWFDNDRSGVHFFQERRIQYPDITAISEVDRSFSNHIVVGDAYRDIVNIAKHRYIFDGRYKLIYMPRREGVAYELYDAHRDPDDRTDLARRDPATRERLARELFRWMTRNGDVVVKNGFVVPR